VRSALRGSLATVLNDVVHATSQVGPSHSGDHGTVIQCDASVALLRETDLELALAF
jgi:hypothetical protein